jgi:hypothetical protein
MNPKPAQTRSSPIPKRTVELLASTPYRLVRRTTDDVVLANGREFERWRRVDVPRKGYAILIDGVEYEFDSTVEG